MFSIDLNLKLGTSFLTSEKKVSSAKTPLAQKADTSNVIKSSPSSFFAAHASMEMTTFSNLHHHHHSLANCPENHQSSLK